MENLFCENFDPRLNISGKVVPGCFQKSGPVLKILFQHEYFAFLVSAKVSCMLATECMSEISFD